MQVEKNPETECGGDDSGVDAGQPSLAYVNKGYGDHDPDAEEVLEGTVQTPDGWKMMWLRRVTTPYQYHCGPIPAGH